MGVFLVGGVSFGSGGASSAACHRVVGGFYPIEDVVYHRVQMRVVIRQRDVQQPAVPQDGGAVCGLESGVPFVNGPMAEGGPAGRAPLRSAGLRAGGRLEPGLSVSAKTALLTGLLLAGSSMGTGRSQDADVGIGWRQPQRKLRRSPSLRCLPRPAHSICAELCPPPSAGATSRRRSRTAPGSRLWRTVRTARERSTGIRLDHAAVGSLRWFPRWSPTRR